MDPATSLLADQYKADKYVDGLVKQMSLLYEQFGRPVKTKSGGVESVLPPTAQRRWEELNKELKAYQQKNYAPLFTQEEE